MEQWLSPLIGFSRNVHKKKPYKYEVHVGLFSKFALLKPVCCFGSLSLVSCQWSISVYQLEMNLCGFLWGLCESSVLLIVLDARHTSSVRTARPRPWWRQSCRSRAVSRDVFLGFFATFQKRWRKRAPRRDPLCVIHSSGMQLQRTTLYQSFLECRRETLSFNLTGGLIVGAQMLPVLHASVLIENLRVWRCAVAPWMQTIKCSLLSVLTLW